MVNERVSRYTYGFQVASYDKRYPLIIDPILEFSTFLGGTGWDEAFSIAVDKSGNTYVTGHTFSADIPTTIGAFDRSFNSYCYEWCFPDVFVAKLNYSGSWLEYSTYIGGVDADAATSIAVDSLGNTYIAGQTYSGNFPTTTGAFNTSFNNGDGFVVKLNSSGSELEYSTFLGGRGDDGALALTVDNSGNALCDWIYELR